MKEGYPTQLDEIDQWLYDNFGILAGACSSTENLRHTTARRIAEALWPKNDVPLPEDSVLFNKGVAEGRRLEREEKNGYMERTSPFILSESFNWDTFRAEAAKDLLCAAMLSGIQDTWRIMCENAIIGANELIKQLKEYEQEDYNYPH